MCNLDEVGCTPAREAHGHTRHKVYITRSQSGQQRSPEFKNVRRITILGVIFASGCRGDPMFVVEGASIRYRLLSDGQIETLADCLPRHSTITTRETVSYIYIDLLFGRPGAGYSLDAVHGTTSMLDKATMNTRRHSITAREKTTPSLYRKQ